MNRVVPVWAQRLLGAPFSRGLGSFQPRFGRLSHDHYRIGLQIALSLGDRAQFYCRLRNTWDFDPGMYDLLYARPDEFRQLPPARHYFDRHFQDGRNFLDQVLRVEFQNKMVNDFLLNEDRVTSAHGVEGRVPFLDRDFVERALRIPAAMKMNGWETKALWKKAIGDILPESIMRKKKSRVLPLALTING